MTMPAPQFLDTGNPLLAGGPAKLDTGSITTEDGQQAGVLTVRTSSATVTVLLNATSLDEWGDLIKTLAASLGGGKKLQAASVFDVASLDPTMQGKRR